MNVVHLHSDEKFIYESKRFLDKDFTNTIVYYGNSHLGLTLKTRKMFEVTVLKNSKTLLNDIIKIISDKEADLLVVYDLDPTKIALINKMKNPIKIVWRFFGHELYKIDKQKYLTADTIAINNKAKVSLTRKIFNYSIYKKSLITKEIYYNYNFDYKDALQKISAFMGICKEEYNYLHNEYGPLPYFINIPLDELELDNSSINKTKSKIIIGNSRNDFNNHSEILEILIPSKNKYILPFSYGTTNHYSAYIKKLAVSKEVQVLDRFIPLEKYLGLLSSCTTLVLNTKRQMAMGNIVLSVYKGLKVYLNEENSLFEFFKNNNLICYPISNFRKDLESDNLMLTNDQIISNIKAFNSYCRNNDYSLFLKSIKDLKS